MRIHFSNLFFVTALIAAGTLQLPAGAATPRPPTAPETTSAPSRDARLDTLFAKLKHQANADAAKQTADAIQSIWRHSGSPTIDLLMEWSSKAISDKHYATALDLLDQVTMLEPEYAEGWNQRAAVHFLMSDYAKSMADIDKTLSLEPRHFGALSGMATIFKALGKDRLAMDVLEKVLAIYPADHDAQQRLGDLADELAGESI